MSSDLQRTFDTLGDFGSVLTIKLYRLELSPAPAVPILPCLDHEAMLHHVVARHAAAYIQEKSSPDIHEVVFLPDERRIEVDIVSTWKEYSQESHQRLLAWLTQRFPDYKVVVTGPSRWRGHPRVAEACRAQVTLRDVLLGTDFDAIKARIDRLQTVSSLMEKHSRAASWGVRTVAGPVLPAVAVVTFLLLGSATGLIGEGMLNVLAYVVVGLIGTAFLYYGLKAVQLTEMSNRVWKRTAEYGLILAERRRLARGASS